MKIYPKDWVEPVETGPLEVDDKKKAEMVAKAKTLFDKPIEEGDLIDKLEQYYVFEKGEHYNSTQLKEVVEQVAKDLAPEAQEESITE